MKVLTDATLRVRDCIYEGLLRRRDATLTEDVARERANNIATAVIETLIEDLKALTEESAAVDMSGTESEPCPGCGRDGSIKCVPSGLCYCDVCHYTFDSAEQQR